MCDFHLKSLYLAACMAWQWINEGGIMFVCIKSLVYIFSGLFSLFGSTVNTRIRTNLYAC